MVVGAKRYIDDVNDALTFASLNEDMILQYKWEYKSKNYSGII